MRKRLNDREIFMFAVGAVQVAAINPTERRKMVQVYKDAVAGIKHRKGK